MSEKAQEISHFDLNWPFQANLEWPKLVREILSNCCPIWNHIWEASTSLWRTWDFLSPSKSVYAHGIPRVATAGVRGPVRYCFNLNFRNFHTSWLKRLLILAADWWASYVWETSSSEGAPKQKPLQKQQPTVKCRPHDLPWRLFFVRRTTSTSRNMLAPRPPPFVFYYILLFKAQTHFALGFHFMR